MDYSQKKLVELRNICKDFKIKSTGTKSDMIKRIHQHKFHENKSSQKKMILYPYSTNLYKSIESYKKIYSFIIKKSSYEVVGKLNNSNNKLEDLEKDDLEHCRLHNIPYCIPINIRGHFDTHRIRTVLEEDDDDFEEEYNDLNE